MTARAITVASITAAWLLVGIGAALQSWEVSALALVPLAAAGTAATRGRHEPNVEDMVARGREVARALKAYDRAGGW